MSGVRARVSASVPSNSVRTAARTTLSVGAVGFVDDVVAVRIGDDGTDLDTVRGAKASAYKQRLSVVATPKER